MKKKITILICVLALICFGGLFGCDFSNGDSSSEGKYTVNFYNGEELVYTQKVNRSADVTMPTVSEKLGYNFLGWYNKVGGKFYSGVGLAYNGNDFYATYEAIEYTISYELNGGINDTLNPTTYTIEDNITIKNPTKEGYAFLGWVGGIADKPTLDYTINGSTGDIVFTATWGENNLKYLYFDTIGGSVVEDLKNTTGRFTLPTTIPTKDGYDFAGWYYDKEYQNQPISNTVVVRDASAVLYAKWTPKTYTISFLECDNEQVAYNIDSETFTVIRPTKEGHEFIGWTYDGESTPQKDYIVKQGSYGDITLTANWKILSYTITFITNGGNNIEQMTVEYNSVLSLPTPTKDLCDFAYWCVDKSTEEKFTLTKMPAYNLTLYAKWTSDYYFKLSYNGADANENEITDVVVADKQNGEYILCESDINLSAKGYCVSIGKGYAFDYWLYDDTKVYDNVISLKMPSKEFLITAVYKEISVGYQVNKSNLTNLTIQTELSNVTKVVGGDINSEDYSVSNGVVTINSGYLSSLNEGVYAYCCHNTGSCFYFMISVYDSVTTISNIDIDYDSKHPNICLYFDGEPFSDYEYSLNGGTYKAVKSGDIISDYNKKATNTITIRNKDDLQDSLTASKDGVSSLSYQTYLNNTFTYGGETYDYYIENQKEFEIFMQYCFYVGVATELTTFGSVYGQFKKDYLRSNEFSTDFGDSTKYEDFLSKYSAPYSPTYSYAESSKQKGTVIITLTCELGNKKMSTQIEETFTDMQKLLKQSTRDSEFNDFYIESLTKTQEIRSIYELESLPYGVKPTFSDKTSDAYIVYNKAKEILRDIISDDMTDYQKVSSIYDYLATHITYDTVVADLSGQLVSDIGSYSAFTSYGALVNNIAVCDGIASAMALMCNIEGIEAKEVTGGANGGGHAWVKFKINDIWYGADPTWATTGVTYGYTTYNYVTHKYLFADESTLILSGHTENDKGSGTNSIPNIALGVGDYYTLSSIVDGYDLSIDDVTELKNVLLTAYNQGIKLIELKYNGNYTSDSAMLSVKRNNFLLSSKIRGYTTANKGGTFVVLFN